MDKLLEIYKLLKVTEKEIEDVNKCMNSKEIELIMKNFLTKKNTGPLNLIKRLYQSFTISPRK